MHFMNKEIRKFLTDRLSLSDHPKITPIKKGGSDRDFFRVVAEDQSSFVFMRYGVEIKENLYWAGINKFLSSINISVPQIIAQDLRQHFILMEDLGDIDLCSQASLPGEKRRDYYFETLTQIRCLHSFPANNLPSGLKLAKGYDRQLYLWEHNYFRENFVEVVCHIKLPAIFQKELADELSALAGRMLNAEPCLIHRDFQSQNIMIKNDQPVLIDFQGMRRGNFFYDLGSLICDPYVTFVEKERNELISFYYQIRKPPYGLDEFTTHFWEASAQRLMQALGAYGFLGLKKNKPDFLKHIDNGLANLLLAVDHAPKLAGLNDLALKCATPIKNH